MTIPTALTLRIGRQSLAPLLKIAKRRRQPIPRYSHSGEKQSPAHGVACRSSPGFRRQFCAIESNIQVDDFQGVFLDEFPPRFHVFAHERRENIFGGDSIFKLHLQQRARIRVHGRVPELLGVHFAEALESRDGEIFFGVLDHIVQNIPRFFLGYFRTVVRHYERRLVEFIDQLGKRTQALVLRGGGQRPVDFLAVRRAKLNFVQAVLFVESDLAFELELGFVDFLQEFLQRLLVFKIGFLFEAALREQLNKARLAQTAAELRRGGFVLLHVQQELRQSRAFQRNPLLGFHHMVLGGALHQLVGEIALVANVPLRLPALHAIERRLRDVHVAALDQLLHVAKEKREQQGADVAAVDVRVGHQNYFVIAQLAGVEIILADPGAQRGDDGANFLVAEHLVVPRLFDVKNFALERQDRLVFPVAAHFCGAARGFALDDEQFAPRRIALLALGQFSGQAAGIHRGFAAGQLAGFARGFAGARGFNALADDAARDGGVLVKPFAQALVHKLLDVALDVAVKFAFGLAFKLRLREAHTDNGDETFTDIVTADADLVFLLFQHAGGRREIVDGAR